MSDMQWFNNYDTLVLKKLEEQENAIVLELTFTEINKIELLSTKYL